MNIDPHFQIQRRDCKFKKRKDGAITSLERRLLAIPFCRGRGIEAFALEYSDTEFGNDYLALEQG